MRRVYRKNRTLFYRIEAGFLSRTSVEQYETQILIGKLGREAIEASIKEEPDLQDRSWILVKNFCGTI